MLLRRRVLLCTTWPPKSSGNKITAIVTFGFARTTQNKKVLSCVAFLQNNFSYLDIFVPSEPWRNCHYALRPTYGVNLFQIGKILFSSARFFCLARHTQKILGKRISIHEKTPVNNRGFYYAVKLIWLIVSKRLFLL